MVFDPLQPDDVTAHVQYALWHFHRENAGHGSILDIYHKISG